MLNELVKRLTGGRVERREAERFRKRYPVAWLRGHTLIAGLGLEISVKGIRFATKEGPPGDHVDVAIDLDGRRVRARLSIARRGLMKREGTEWAVVAGVFEASRLTTGTQSCASVMTRASLGTKPPRS